RDRIAYVRVASGVFERGMQVTNVRTGRGFSTKYAHQLFGRERDTVERAYPGDIVGLVNAGDLHIGDTVTTGAKFLYPPIPTFAPEHFRVGRNMDTSRYKQFRRGSPSSTKRAWSRCCAIPTGESRSRSWRRWGRCSTTSPSTASRTSSGRRSN